MSTCIHISATATVMHLCSYAFIRFSWALLTTDLWPNLKPMPDYVTVLIPLLMLFAHARIMCVPLYVPA